MNWEQCLTSHATVDAFLQTEYPDVQMETTQTCLMGSYPSTKLPSNMHAGQVLFPPEMSLTPGNKS